MLDMRLFVAMSGSDVGGSTRPCVESLKICGESKVLALLAETFALWAANLQATTFTDYLYEILCPMQFCHETTKFIEICLQHMPMDLIPEIDDVTVLLSNLQRNPSVSVVCLQYFSSMTRLS
jgi:hypothetical protein